MRSKSKKCDFKGCHNKASYGLIVFGDYFRCCKKHHADTIKIYNDAVSSSAKVLAEEISKDIIEMILKEVSKK